MRDPKKYQFSCENSSYFYHYFLAWREGQSQRQTSDDPLTMGSGRSREYAKSHRQESSWEQEVNVFPISVREKLRDHSIKNSEGFWDS